MIMPEQTPDRGERVGNQVPQLVVTWLVVSVPLAYGLFETVKSVIPLFTS